MMKKVYMYYSMNNKSFFQFDILSDRFSSSNSEIKFVHFTVIEIMNIRKMEFIYLYIFWYKFVFCYCVCTYDHLKLKQYR